MGNNLKEVMIIDLFGFPGSGKTTVLRELIDQLQKNKVKVQANIFNINNNKSIMIRLSIKTINTILYTINNFGFMYELFTMLGKKPFKSIGEAIKQWVNVCFVLTQLNKSDGYDLVVADQGIIQAAVSLAINSNSVDINAIIELMKKQVRQPLVFVFVKNDINTTLNRLERRTKGKSRIDIEENHNKKISYLIKYENLFSEIINKNEFMVFENSNPLGDKKLEKQFYSQLKFVIEKYKFFSANR